MKNVSFMKLSFYIPALLAKILQAYIWAWYGNIITTTVWIHYIEFKKRLP